MKVNSFVAKFLETIFASISRAIYFLQGVLFHTLSLVIVCIVATAVAIPYKELKPNYETVVHDMVLLHPQGTVSKKNKMF